MVNSECLRCSWRLCISLFSLILPGCTPTYVPPSPVDLTEPNDYFSVQLCREPARTPLGDITLKQGEGFEACVRLAVKENAPTELDGRKLTPTVQWPVCITCYPAEPREGVEPVTYGCFPWTLSVGEGNAPVMFFPRGPHFPDSREMPLPVERMIALPPLRENAYQLRPPIQAGTYEHWTYFGSPFEEPGEYVYEIRVFPTGRHLTPSSAEPGWEVIAARGRLTVLAK